MMDQPGACGWLQFSSAPQQGVWDVTEDGDLNESLCEKQECTSQSIGQSTTRAWKGSERVAAAGGG